MKVISNLQLMLMILLLTTLAPAANDTYVVSLPYIAHYYLIDTKLVQLSVVYFNIGSGLGIVIFGSLSDCYGRRPIAMSCLIIGLLGTILCAIAPNIEILCCGKFIQGLSLSSCVVLSKSIMRDVSANNTDMAKLSSKISIFFAIFINLSLPVGGYIQQHWFWQTIFYCLCVHYLIVFMLLYYRLPETNVLMVKISWTKMMHNFYIIFKNMNFLKYSINSALVFAALSAYITSVPDILETELSVSPEHVGIIAIILMCARMSAGFINSILLEKTTLSVMLTFSSLVMVVSAMMMLILVKMEVLHIYSILIPGFFFLFGGAITFINASSIAIGSFPDKSGTASSAYGIIQQLLGATIGSLLVALIPGKMEVNLSYLMLIFAILCLCINKVRFKKRYL